jgi:uncharacterized protein (DUF305 family)
VLPVVLAAVVCASCGAGRAGTAPIVQPGAPGRPTRAISAGDAVDLSRVPVTPADVRFMQRMIGHHAQALEMTALVSSRTPSEDMRLLTQRIEVSQADEIAYMRGWLEARGEPLPDVHAQHEASAPAMPGMLTADEMARLAAASGAEFERRFLEGMIKHHEGALVMVQELLATPGAAQQAEIFAFSADVDADQRIEIERMRGMLDAR